ncbi:hypothetical protein ANANG_G00147000 [Anguilla anguilla]|uniref:Uridylate-specific endoribonuclease n=1 Tax=Anguilla anguilla TaxID=7936 RepID=A0A9D3MHN5_ANGAN|nr:hypothetical protein ANANG_G00147000 [Anguilla anguilla]
MARRCSGRDVSLLLLFFTLTCTRLDASSPVVDQELSDIINELWKLDTNRLKPGTDYTISLQGKAGFVTQGTNTARDHAQSPLFSHVNEAKLKSIKTYSNFLDLLDNYEKSTGVTEKVTPEELAENYRFLDSILQTEVMKRAHKYLVSKGKSSTDLRLFKNQLYDIWFRLYHRDRIQLERAGQFEVALFTIVFLKSTVRVTHTVINVDEYQLEVVVYRHGRSIGTSYPKLLSSNNRHV